MDGDQRRLGEMDRAGGADAPRSPGGNIIPKPEGQLWLRDDGHEDRIFSFWS